VISDRYRIVELVAMGAMGAVYRADHLLMHKQVAVKILHPETEGFPELVSRFEREAVAGAHINHENVAGASDFGKFDGESRFLVLEYIDGETLMDLIFRGPLRAERASNIARQLAKALGAVHDKGIVHRDVKPRNVMILEGKKPGSDHVKLIDFGLAKVPVSELSPRSRDQEMPSLTQAGVVMGTVAYMAPETAMGMRAVQERADLYSLGVVFYEMLAGKHPFDADDPALLFALHRAQPPPPIRERNPAVTVPPAIERVVMRLLEKDPEARYDSTDALIAAIDESLRAEEPTEVAVERPTATSVPSQVPRRAKSNVAVWVLVALLVALAVVLALRRPIAGPAVAASGEPPSASPAPSAAPPAAKPHTRADDLVRAAEADGAAAVKALLELAREEPAAFADPKVRASAATAAQKAATAGGAEADEVFTLLATKLGAPGIDVLFELVRGDESSKGAERARNWLARREVYDTGSAAMKVAYELLRATCSRRQFLFPRAGEEGDERALALLMAMQPPACDSLRGQCCFKRHGDLERAVAAIQARLHP
jgi:hypothetical protein